MEKLINDLKTEIALLQDQLTMVENQAREQEAESRFKRLDLVARLGAIQEAVSAELSATDREALDEGPTHLSRKSVLLPGFSDLEQMRVACDSLDAEILQTDLKIKHLARGSQRKAAGLEQQIQDRVREVNRLQKRLMPVYADLADFVIEQAAGRRDLSEHVIALVEVAGAIQVHQAALKAIGVETP